MHNLTNFSDVKNYFLQKFDNIEKNIGIEPFSSMGKVMSIRKIGQISFYKVSRGDSEIQLVFKKSITRNIQDQSTISYGDWIAFSGDLGVTSTDEFSVFVVDFEILQRCTSQMPEKHAGVNSTTAIHHRHLDLMTNKDSIGVFKHRAQLLRDLRNHFSHLLEVETPSLHKTASGATATPFTTHHEASKSDLHLRISPELNLKKLMVGNIDPQGVFEIGKSFRNEGLSSRHNPEFTMLEAYQYAHTRHTDDTFEEMLTNVKRFLTKWFPFNQINTWSFKDWDINFSHLDKTQENFDLHVEPMLLKQYQVGILIVNHHLNSSSPLAKEYDETHSARCEVYIDGIEVMNSYVEQNCPIKQRESFEKQGFVDEEYLSCLSYGMPQTIGIGIGVDRLLMTLLGLNSIKDVILFPC